MQKPRVGHHEMIGQMIDAIGQKEASDPRAGTKIVAAFLGVGVSTVYKWTDPDQEGEISYLNVCRLTEFYRVTVGATHLAHMGGGLFIQVEPAHPAKQVWLRAARDCGGDVQEALGGLLKALENDGDVDAEEVRSLKLRQLAREAIRELVTLEHNLGLVEKGEEPNVVELKAAGAGR